MKKSFFNKYSNLFCGITLIVLFSGCAPQAQIDMLERNVSGLQIETHRIDEEVKNIRRQMTELQGQAEQGSRKSIARLNARIDSLESELMRLNGLVDQIKYNQEREEAELAKLKQEIQVIVDKAGRLSSAATPIVTRPKDQEIKRPIPEKTPVVEKTQDLYKEGLELFRLKKYQEAKKAFRDFIKQHPNSPMVANAHFWIGECEYRLSRYEEAILEYNKVISKFPKSNKVPDALLKQGFAFAKLGDKESARILLQKLIKNYPRTPQAKAAKRQLRLLK